MSTSDPNEVKLIASRYFIAEKFRKPVMNSVIERNRESIAKALTARRLPYVYLIWKDPRFRDK